LEKNVFLNLVCLFSDTKETWYHVKEKSRVCYIWKFWFW